MAWGETAVLLAFWAEKGPWDGVQIGSEEVADPVREEASVPSERMRDRNRTRPRIGTPLNLLS